MATNPLIALGTRVPNLGGRFANFADQQNALSRLADQDAAAGEEASFQRQRVINKDAVNQTLNEQQITEGRQRIAAAGKERSAIDSAQDAARLLSLPNEQVLPFLNQRRQKLTQAAQSDPSINTVQTDQQIQLAQSGDFQGVRQDAQREVSLATQFGLLQGAGQGKGFTLKPGDVRFNAGGQQLASVDQKPDTKSPARLAQDIKLARATASAKANTPLALAQLRNAQNASSDRDSSIAEDERKITSAREATISNVALMDSTIDDALKSANGLLSTGFAGAVLSNLPGTEADVLKGFIDTLQANLAFNALQEMRDNSKTGGALGAINTRELELLAAKVSKLGVGMKVSQLRKNLETVRKEFQRIKRAATRFTPGQAQKTVTVEF